MPLRLNQNDTFGQWLDKINNLNDTFITSSFEWDEDNTYPALDFTVKSGKFRDGSNVVLLNQITLTMPISTDSTVAIFTRVGEEEIIRYDTSALPDKHVIPLYRVITDGTDITNVTDLRTWADVSGNASDANAILTFDKIVDRDITIPSTKNAISVDPVIGSGVTVTVDSSSTWVIL